MYTEIPPFVGAWSKAVTALDRRDRLRHQEGNRVAESCLHRLSMLTDLQPRTMAPRASEWRKGEMTGLLHGKGVIVVSALATLLAEFKPRQASLLLGSYATFMSSASRTTLDTAIKEIDHRNSGRPTDSFGW